MKLETSRAQSALKQHLPRCERCNGALTVPEWSEQVSTRCVRHYWSCDTCGYQFESWVYHAKSDAAQFA